MVSTINFTSLFGYSNYIHKYSVASTGENTLYIHVLICLMSQNSITHCLLQLMIIGIQFAFKLKI